MLRLPTSLALAALLTTAAQATTTRSTEPVGFMRPTVEPGLQTIGFPLTNAAVLTSVVANVGADNVVASVDCQTRLNADAAYYLEFAAGPDGETTFVGERLEVDVAATLATGNANNRIVVKLASDRSTLHALPTALAGYRFELRPHVTLASALGTGVASSLQPGISAATGDQVFFLQNGSFVTYLFRADRSGSPGSWVKFPEGTPADNVAIPPGTGLFVRRVGSGAVAFEHLGSVRTHAFVQPLDAGYTLISEPFPVTASFASRGMSELNGFVAGSTSASADCVDVWSGATYRTLFYATAAGVTPNWRPTDVSTQSVEIGDAEALFSPFHAVLVHKLAADPAYVVPCPF